MDGNFLPVGCVIMASGFSKRFGENKLMCDFDGRTLIAHILDTTAEADFAKRVVVTRYKEVAKLCVHYDTDVILHKLPYKNDTVRLGLSHLLAYEKSEAFSGAPMAGCLFCPADQPLLSAGSIRNMLAAFYQNPENIYRLSYGETAGSPILFPKSMYGELLCLPEGKGGAFLLDAQPDRQVIRIPARNPYELYDIDTRKDLLCLTETLYNRHLRG